MVNYSISDFKIHIGNHPHYNENDEEGILNSYDAIVNVSDDPAYGLDGNARIYWFPISEFGYWTYQPFFWFVKLMDHHLEKQDRIYVHCHAGIHRSPMMVYLYIRSLGFSPDEAYSKFNASFSSDENTNWLEETFQNDVEYGRIPADVVEFMKDVQANKEMSMMSVMKKRGVLDLPSKTTEKRGVKKPVGQAQIIQNKKGLF
jgi:hypothetical protein